MNTVQEWLQQASIRLASGPDPETARLDAELLVGHITGFSRTRVYAYPEQALDTCQQISLEALLQRRIDGEPLAYLTGSREFWSLPLKVSTGVLIPRPDTELLVEKVLELHEYAPAGPILELGTGTGAIALALAQELDTREIIAVERHAEALAIAASNINNFGKSRVQLLQGDWMNAIRNKCAALILANPPYLAQDDEYLPGLSFEPQSALVSGQSGLEDIEKIIAATCRVGLPGCLLMLEHGYQQGASVRSLLSEYAYQHIQTDQDLAGHDRITYGYLGLKKAPL